MHPIWEHQGQKVYSWDTSSLIDILMTGKLFTSTGPSKSSMHFSKVSLPHHHQIQTYYVHTQSSCSCLTWANIPNALQGCVENILAGYVCSPLPFIITGYWSGQWPDNAPVPVIVNWPTPAYQLPLSTSTYLLHIK